VRVAVVIHTTVTFVGQKGTTFPTNVLFGMKWKIFPTQVKEGTLKTK
jgi:hypothetical protein